MKPGTIHTNTKMTACLTNFTFTSYSLYYYYRSYYYYMQYTLETFCEGRTTCRTEVPFFGGTVDGPYNGRPPMPWDFQVNPTQQFGDEIQKIPVPHTEEVRVSKPKLYS